jgi:hypothetical protein
MNKYIKQIIILVIIFIIILWVQNNDDKKKNKIRKSYYDKIKLPLLATSLVGLVLNVDIEKLIIINQPYVNSNASINRIPTNYNYNTNLDRNYNNTLDRQDIFTSEFDARY